MVAGEITKDKEQKIGMDGYELMHISKNIGAYGVVIAGEKITPLNMRWLWRSIHSQVCSIGLTGANAENGQ